MHSWNGGMFRSIMVVFIFQQGWASLLTSSVKQNTPNLVDTHSTTLESPSDSLSKDILFAPLPSDPLIHELNAQIWHSIANSNREKRTRTVESCSHKCKPSRLWSIIKFLDRKHAETPPNQPITFSSKTLTCNLEISTAFANQFISAVSHTRDQSTWIVRRKLLKECQLDRSVPTFLLILFRRLLKSATILLPLL